MKTKKEKKLLIALMFFAMALTGTILNTYISLSESIVFDTAKFTSILLKSFGISLVLLVVLVATNYKRFKS